MHKVLKTSRSGRLYAAVTLASVVLLSSSAGATTLLKKNFDDLVTEADAIVVGTVIDTQSHYGADKKIETVVTLADLQVVHGRYEGASLSLQLPGGAVENDIMVVHGAPRFAVRDRVILFVQNNGRQLVPFVGWTQGVFRIETDGATGRQQVLDHERNPVVEVRGSDVVKQQVNAPEATIVNGIGKMDAVGSGGTTDNGTAATAVRSEAAGRQAIDSASFLLAIGNKVREKQAAGRQVQSIATAPAADAQPGQAAPPPPQR